METPENSWFKRTPPTLPDIEEVWQDILVLAQDEVARWLPPGSSAIKFIAKQSIHNLHICISTKDLQAEDQQNSDENAAEDEMPSFDDEKNEEKEEKETNGEPEEDTQGSVIVEETEWTITEQSVLRICMEIRTYSYKYLSAGITERQGRGVELPHTMALKIIQKLSHKHRMIFADILLYQLAEQIHEEELDDVTDGWMDLPSIIDAHLDMANIREFHALLAGNGE